MKSGPDMKWVLTGVGVVLMAIALLLYRDDHSVTTLGILIVGAFLTVVGGVLDRLTSFDLSLTGAKATMAALDAAEDQVKRGQVTDVQTALAAHENPTITESVPAVARVLLTDGCAKAIEGLNAEDWAAVQSVLQEMQVPGYGGDVALPDKRYWVRVVNDNVRLVYRALDRANKNDPGGFVILNVVRPGSALWSTTDRALSLS